MATSFIFNGSKKVIPGAYSQIKSGIQNPALALSYGSFLAIDTGSGKFYGGGSGVAGTHKQGKDAIYTFDSIQDVRNYMHGGLWHFLAGPLFFPGGGATQGISSFSFIRACATTPASISYTLEGGGANGGTLNVQLLNEGRVGNGVLGDETRATSTLTLTADGGGLVEDDSISISIGSDVIASYTVESGDTLVEVIAGLSASMLEIGLAEKVSQTTTTIVFKATRGLGASANSITPSVVDGGTVTGVATQFSGGVDGTNLTRGYAAKMIAGVSDTSKFIIQFYRGTFRGLDTDVSSGDPYDGISEAISVPELVVQTPEFDNLQDVIDWMATDYTFTQFFKDNGSAIAGDGSVDSDDLAANAGYTLATGGTETYSPTHLASALDAIGGLNFDFILADKWGDNARHANNIAILADIVNVAKIKPDMYVAGGRDVSKWNSGNTSSIPVATAYNSQYVTLTHGGVKLTDYSGRRLKEYDSIVHAAYWIGREAGMEPQIPLTFKGIGVDGVLHVLSDKEVELGLSSGVLMARPDGSSAADCLKGVNTLQNNDFTVNPDGTTHSKQLRRIARQLNKEIVVNARQQLLKKPNGTNRNTLNPEDVKSWLEGYLSTKLANQTQDGLILEFKNVVVTRQQDAYVITYQVVCNTEISFLFFSGTIID